MKALERMKARLAAITPGDWTYHNGTSRVEVLPKFDLHRFDQMPTDIFKVQESDADGIFAANAPTDLAYLLAELRTAREALAAVAVLADAADAATRCKCHKIGVAPYVIRAAVAAADGGGARG